MQKVPARSIGAMVGIKDDTEDGEDDVEERVRSRCYAFPLKWDRSADQIRISTETLVRRIRILIRVGL